VVLSDHLHKRFEQPNGNFVGAIVSVALVVGMFSSCSPNRQFSGGADSTSTSDTGSSRTYRHRPVYGGGGGGVGK